MHVARLYEPLSDGKVRCNLCRRQCTISNGNSGFCKMRVNRDGELHTLTYGNLSAIESRPIEIKPFFHYHPGSTSLTFSTWSCNFNCAWCQNYRLSGVSPTTLPEEHWRPQQVLDLALYAGDDGICVSFNEPTLLFEFCLDLFPMAKARGLYCCFVSNGYMTIEALDRLIDAGLDGMNVDIKGRQWAYDRYCGGAKVEHIWETATYAKHRGVHIEIVCLLVTGVSDDDETIDWLIETHLQMLGADVPIHFTRYFPARAFTAPPTPLSTLERAYERAKGAKLRYVYLGNVRGHQAENTYCPTCSAELIVRRGFATVFVNLTQDNRCPKCGERIPIVGKPRVTK